MRLFFLILLCFYIATTSAQKRIEFKNAFKDIKSSKIGVGVYGLGQYGGVSVKLKDKFYKGSTLEGTVLILNPYQYNALAIKYSHQFIKTQTNLDWLEINPYFHGLGGILVNFNPKDGQAVLFPAINVGVGCEFMFIDQLGLTLELGFGDFVARPSPYFQFNGGVGVHYYFKLK
ncbi:MAG: hypothetical protein QM539_03725 [Alphaproteobacteria bacterium]|nr:hypothetical protein [Alphaproteobacteria bacterium]